MTNPILKELHDIRDEILAEHKDDLTNYLRAGIAQTKASGHPIAKVKQRTIRPIETSERGGGQRGIIEIVEESHDHQ